MPFVEVFTPKGAVSSDARAAISEALVGEVMRAEGAPDTETARSISWLMWHEIDEWWVGADRLNGSEPARYVVRVGVPAGSLDDWKRKDIVERAHAVLAKADPDPDRLEREPIAWVHIDEIPEGNWGAMGRVVRFGDIAGYVLDGTIA
jgi:phenylpyruvate tautomerase PptA (4-oxalocrotonate tautomerase family)